MKILTIIVTYNGMRWLERCLNSIVNSSINLDAYIIDNGSTDGSQQYIKDNYPQFIFYQSPSNSGFGAANNIGLSYAATHDYDYVYLLNQDAWVESDTIEVLIKTNKENPQYGILSPLQTNAAITRLDKGFAFYARTKDNLLISDALLGRYKAVYPVDFIMAAHWLVSRKCLATVGGFSPIFFHYGEDVDYINRSIYHNFKVGIVTSVKAIHDREDRKLSERTEMFLYEAKFLQPFLNLNASIFEAAIRPYASLLYNTVRLLFKYKRIKIIVTLFMLTFMIPKLTLARRQVKHTIGIYLYRYRRLDHPIK